MPLHEEWEHTAPDYLDHVARAIFALAPERDNFTSVVVSGVSGMVVGAVVAVRIGRPLVVIRKSEETGREKAHWNITNAGDRPLFLDGSISTGETLRRVEFALKLHGKRLAGIYLYGTEAAEIDWRKDLAN